MVNLDVQSRNASASRLLDRFETKAPAKGFSFFQIIERNKNG
jgi:hypothetical protein